jgi:hypothetical protein
MSSRSLLARRRKCHWILSSHSFLEDYVRGSLWSAWQFAVTVHEKLVYAVWLRHEKGTDIWMMAHQPIAVARNWNVWTLPWYLALHPNCPLMLVPVTARRWIWVPAFLVLHLLAAESQMTLHSTVMSIDNSAMQPTANGCSFHSILCYAKWWVFRVPDCWYRVFREWDHGNW